MLSPLRGFADDLLRDLRADAHSYVLSPLRGSADGLLVARALEEFVFTAMDEESASIGPLMLVFCGTVQMFDEQ